MDLGGKIRRVRLQKRMTIPVLADATNLSRGFVSQVENNKTSISLENLYKIADALDVPVISLLQQDEFAPKIIRQDTRLTITKGEQPPVQLLSSPFNHRLQVFLSELPPGYQAGGCSHYHEGDEWLMVLHGEVMVTQDEFSAILKKGDCLHWNGNLPHSFENAGDFPATILAVNTPPAMLPLEKIKNNCSKLD